MNDILSALLGFFFTVVLLLTIFENCGFSIGCGRRGHMERLTNPTTIRQIMMEEVKSCPGPLAPPPSANDVVEGFASVEASGSDIPQPSLPPMPGPERQKAINANDNYLEHPIHPMFPHDPMGKGHGRVMN